MCIEKTICYGKSRKKVAELTFRMSHVQKMDCENYKTEVSILGFPEEFNRGWTPCVEIEKREKNEVDPRYLTLDKVIEACSEFNALLYAMAYFRQFLRKYLEENPKIRLYERSVDELVELEIDEIFETLDCVPE